MEQLNRSTVCRINYLVEEGFLDDQKATLSADEDVVMDIGTMPMDMLSGMVKALMEARVEIDLKPVGWTSVGDCHIFPLRSVADDMYSVAKHVPLVDLSTGLATDNVTVHMILGMREESSPGMVVVSGAYMLRETGRYSADDGLVGKDCKAIFKWMVDSIRAKSLMSVAVEL